LNDLIGSTGLQIGPGAPRCATRRRRRCSQRQSSRGPVSY